MIDDSYAGRARFRLLSWIALTGAILVGAQVIALLVGGKIICLNDGCRVVESLTTVTPLIFNILGFGWFAVTAFVLRRASRRIQRSADWPRLLLLAGMAFESVLLGYQTYVARSFCAYCLLVFLLVFALNILAGRRQVITAVAILGAVLFTLSLLRFGWIPRPVPPGSRVLDAGTFAVRRCSDPTKQLYLIFSSTCPHCREVIEALQSCNSCNFHFNPIDRLGAFELPDIERSAAYAPEVNRMLLSFLGIREVPVLLAVVPEGITVIKGEQAIVGFIKEECFRQAPGLYMDQSRSLQTDPLRLFRQDDGCDATVECEDQAKKP